MASKHVCEAYIYIPGHILGQPVLCQMLSHGRRTSQDIFTRTRGWDDFTTSLSREKAERQPNDRLALWESSRGMAVLKTLQIHRLGYDEKMLRRQTVPV